MTDDDDEEESGLYSASQLQSLLNAFKWWWDYNIDLGIVSVTEGAAGSSKPVSQGKGTNFFF